MKHLLFILLILISIHSCKETSFLNSNDISTETEVSDQLVRPNHYSAYYPDSTFAIRYVRVNFHIMRDGKGLHNFSEEEGTAYIHEYLIETNKKLADNQKMFIPDGNNTPVLPTRYRFELAPDPNIDGDDGIYFHNDEELYNFVKRSKKRSQMSNFIFKKYGVQKGKVLNVFVQPHHPDSLKSKTFKKVITGIAFPNKNWLRLAGLYSYSRDTMGIKKGVAVTKGAWFCAGLMNHESGHVLGIHHTWSGNDGCSDTPNNPNCYTRQKNAPCNTKASNNVMDYNTYQNAWSPCQLGKVHRNFSNKNSAQRKMLKRTWCSLNPDATITIKDKTVWTGSRDLEGHLIIGKRAVLEIKSRVSLPKDGQIIIKPGGKLILNGAKLENDCGDYWSGIVLEKRGESKGQVVIINNAVIKDNTNGYRTKPKKGSTSKKKNNKKKK